MSFPWSFSTDRLFRRCQRQFYYREIAAHHNAKEVWRREAFVLKQLKTLELWRGSLIHEGIENFLVPVLKQGIKPNWEQITLKTLNRAREQLKFSEAKRYREEGVTKSKNDDYCALVAHETGSGVSSEEFERVCSEIRRAFDRLEHLSELWNVLDGKRDFHPELKLWANFGTVKINVQIDLFLQRNWGHPTIIDWKSFEVGGDTDTRRQILLYAWAVMEKGDHGVQQPEDIDLYECQVQDGVLIKHECSQEAFDELEDYIYRSVEDIQSLCSSKKFGEIELENFAFTENSNNCEHCVFNALCVEQSMSIENPFCAKNSQIVP